MGAASFTPPHWLQTLGPWRGHAETFKSLQVFFETTGCQKQIKYLWLSVRRFLRSAIVLGNLQPQRLPIRTMSVTHGWTMIASSFVVKLEMPCSSTVVVNSRWYCTQVMKWCVWPGPEPCAYPIVGFWIQVLPCSPCEPRSLLCVASFSRGFIAGWSRDHRKCYEILWKANNKSISQ